MKTIECWHFLAEDRRTRNDSDTKHPESAGVLVTPGLKLSMPEDIIVPCECGFHGSEKAMDALSYAPGPIICRVVLSGKIIPHQNDKFCASEREVLWMADATRTLHEFACWTAEQVLYLFEKDFPEDARPRKAIQAKRDWLSGKITDEELAAARDAAWDAARDARDAWAARAAWAAWDAARDARAARDAWAARAAWAAWAAARAAQEKQLTQMLMELKP